MIQMELEICLIDNKPIDESQAYRVLRDEVGDEYARKWVRRIVIPPDEQAS
jgi:hypothetical protein